MRRIIIVLILILAVLVTPSCSNRPGVTVTFVSADTSGQERPTTEPPTSVTMQSIHEDTPQQLVKEDVPAYLAVGLPPRSEMAPAQERYYYQMNANYIHHSIDDFSEYNIYFDKTASVDFDGDGKEETITLIGGKPGEHPEYDFLDITIDIDGSRLKLGKGRDYLFELNGTILDIDKDDGKKEILIYASGLETGWTEYIISYDNKKLHKILDDQLLIYNEPADGTGYVITLEADNYLYYIGLLKLKGDMSGLERADNEYYPTEYQQFCWDENGNWDEGQAARTQSDQYLYNGSDGNDKVLVKQGTPIFIGLYAKNGRLMILNAKGELLGWLDTKKVDLHEYTGYAFDSGDDAG